MESLENGNQLVKSVDSEESFPKLLLRFEEQERNNNNHNSSSINNNNNNSSISASSFYGNSNVKKEAGIKLIHFQIENNTSVAATKSPGTTNTKPSIKLAELHKLASRVSMPSVKKRDSESEQKSLCECCGMPFKNDLIPLNVNVKKLAFLGPGIPLYFLFFRLCLVQLLVMTFFFGAYMTYENAMGSNCQYYPDTLDDLALQNAGLEKEHLKGCSLNSLSRVSLINKANSSQSLKLQSWLVFGQVILSLVYHQYAIRQLRNMEEQSDANVFSPSDYTIMVQRIPQHMGTEKAIAAQVKKVYEQLGEKEPLTISKVCLAYNISEYIKLTRLFEKLSIKKNQLIQKIEKMNANANVSIARRMQYLTNKLSSLKNEIEALESMYHSGKQSLFTGTAFVTLMTQIATRNFDKMKQEGSLLKRLKTAFAYIPSLLGCKPSFSSIQISRAPEPGDILWENLGFSMHLIIKHRVATFFFSVLLLTISFTALFLLNIYVNQLRNSRNNADNSLTIDYFAISLAKSSVVVVLNIIINLMNDWFAKFEKRSSISGYLVSSLFKISLTQFLNTSLVLPLASYFAGSKLWINWDLLFQITLVVFVESFSKSISELISFPFIMKKFKRWRLKLNPGASFLTQSMLNRLFEGDAFRLDLKCSYLIRVMWTTAFFTPLIPVTSLVSLVGLFLKYWSDKYLLLRRHVRPSEIGCKVNTQNVNLISVLPLIFSGGHLMFSYFTASELSLEELLPMAISLSSAGLIFLLPMKLFNKILFKRLGVEDHVFSVLCPSYNEIKNSFLTDYDRTNPVTHERALKHWIKEVEESLQSKHLTIFHNVHELVEMIAPNESSSPKKKRPAARPRPSFLSTYAGINFQEKLENNKNTGNIVTTDSKLISANTKVFKTLRTINLTRKATESFKLLPKKKKPMLNRQDTPPGEECSVLRIKTFLKDEKSNFGLRLITSPSTKNDSILESRLDYFKKNQASEKTSGKMDPSFKYISERNESIPIDSCSPSLENVVETQPLDYNSRTFQSQFESYFVKHSPPKKFYDFEETV